VQYVFLRCKTEEDQDTAKAHRKGTQERTEERAPTLMAANHKQGIKNRAPL
jgi:hypothetical protein